MVVTRTNPILAFVVVVLAGAAYFSGVYWVAPNEASNAIPAFANVLLLVAVLIVFPVMGAAYIQRKLTKGYGAPSASKIWQIALAATLGPYIGAWVFWLVLLATGGAL